MSLATRISLILPNSIPSPEQGVWYLGPVPIRAYGLAILLGIIVCLWWTRRRYQARGGDPELVFDLAIWMVPLGIIGGRLYHVITSWQLYFGPNGVPTNAWKIWHGGLGIWGAVAVGAGTGIFLLRRRQLPVGPFADAVAVPLILAQAIGRWGNYFNQELFGSPTNLPWGLEISPSHRPIGFEQVATFHPTFLYEMLWNLLVVGVLLVWEKRRNIYAGQLFALYICGYTLGRIWIEYLRIDEANHILGIRLNIWTSILVFILGYILYRVCGVNRKNSFLAVTEPATSNKTDITAEYETGKVWKNVGTESENSKPETEK